MKAILVIDMPKSCKDCKLTYLDTGDDAYYGNPTQRCIFDGAEVDVDERYYDCPLKPFDEYDCGTVREEPTVEIIRCKDCKYYEIWEMKSGKDGYTDDKRYKPSVCTIGAYAVHRDENWFCADAERKTE